ncbi:MAG: tetratricopeptide repeat protein [Planctomycetes bacterium]|nr:tetratricopeptide repeat protein [Planctomycetota bacterium]
MIALCLAVVTAAAYAPSLRNQLLIWDDNKYVTDNPHLRDGLTAEMVAWAFAPTPDRIVGANWHPLTWLSHAADVELYGTGKEHPWGHHLTSVLLHALNSALLLIALHRLIRRLWPSAVVAALFALHPLHVESVSWVAERKDVLCGTFTFLTLWAYASYASRPSVRRYLLVALAFAAALMSKPMAVTLPFVLLLLDAWPLGRLSWRSVAEKLPLAAMTAAACVVTIWAQRAGGALRDLETVSLLQRAGNAAYAYVMYLVMAVFPWPGTLVPYHPLAHSGGREVSLLMAGGAALILAGATAFALLLRRGRPYLLVGWLIYLGMLVPVIGLVQVGGQLMADRYTYLPLVGAFAGAVWLVAEWAAARPGRRKAVAVATVAMLVVFGGLTVRQQSVWRDTFSLWNCVATAYPRCSAAFVNMGMARYHEGNKPAAMDCYRQAIVANPYCVEAEANLGILLVRDGQIEEGVVHLSRALALNSRWARAHYGLGIAALKQGNVEYAIEAFARAVQSDANFGPARADLGAALLQARRFDEAIAQLSIVLQSKPDHIEARLNMAGALLGKEQYEAAIRQLGVVIRQVGPVPLARQYMAMAYEGLGNAEEARRWWPSEEP